MKMKEYEIVSDKPCIIAEAPLWVEKTNTLWWADINGKRIHYMSLEDGKERAIVVPEQVGCLFLDEDDRINVGATTGIYLLGEDGEFIPRYPLKPSGRRFNDGKVGPDGNLWIGTISREYKAHLFRVFPDGTHEVLLENMGNSNGLDWNTEKRKFYLNDTYKGVTYVYDYDENYNLSNGRVLHDFGVEENPDGMAIDTEGNLYVAMFGGQRLVKLDGETGEVLDEMYFPLPNVTCALFIGKELDEMIVTTAAYRADLLEYPDAGCVLKIKTGTKGFPQYKIKNK